ncbi:flagellar motor protein MotB [Streptomyces sp. NRRL WC-3701]|uniref:DUF4232 domain-containing protein n=1 Tax=Streptomyces sp. NRRL WC-3701 TaxID=1519473 RepID=UPI0006AF8F14|nr:DUF4232 domain-containing protein [Streptomyces sp. NRRL WC-3701]KOT39523.1 flagellar motor protein MotB [Streptomyces sp. NRRL WC-3701]
MSSSATARTALRRTFRIAAAVAGLALTACSGSDAAGTRAADRPDTGVADADPGGAASPTAGQDFSDEVEAKAGSAGEPTAGARAGAGGPGGQRCHTSDLKAAFATGEDAVPDPNASGGTTTSFPGVDLRPDAGGPSWSLARSSAKHGSITLGPGDSTDFTLNLGMAKNNEEGSWKPQTVAVTPPNETTALTLKWPWGPLIHQDGATHPTTFVNPIG